MPDVIEPKRLYRSAGDRILTGVLGGIGEYLGVDPAAVRVLYVILAAITGFFPLTIAYILMVLVVPEKPVK